MGTWSNNKQPETASDAIPGDCVPGMFSMGKGRSCDWCRMWWYGLRRDLAGAAGETGEDAVVEKLA